MNPWDGIKTALVLIVIVLVGALVIQAYNHSGVPTLTEGQKYIRKSEKPMVVPKAPAAKEVGQAKQEEPLVASKKPTN